MPMVATVVPVVFWHTAVVPVGLVVVVATRLIL